MRNEVYYKYRSLKNTRFFLDIMLRHRLYLAKYNELNDPMEGIFLYSREADERIIQRIRDRKQVSFICALSSNPNNGLMWTHYADECNGVCIGVEVNSKSGQLVDVIYDRDIPEITPDTTALEILSHKAPAWQYEQEVRFIRTGETSSRYLNVKVKKVIFGHRVDSKDYKLYSDLINKIDPTIKISRMSKDNLEFGFERNREHL